MLFDSPYNCIELIHVINIIHSFSSNLNQTIDFVRIKKILKYTQVENFKYLGIDVNIRNNHNEEIQLRIKGENRYYFKLQKTFKSKVLLKNKKMIIQGFNKTWPTSNKDKRKLTVLERKFLRRILDSKKNDQKGERGIRSNKEIKDLWREEDVIQALKRK